MCLELSKCGSSGPQSLYQCHNRAFSSHLSAQRLLFHPLRAGKTLGLTMDGSTQSTFFIFYLCFYIFLAHTIASLKITLCLNAFFPSLNPIIFVEVQSTEKLLHFTTSAHSISNCSLNTRVGCKYRSMSSYLKDFLECVWGF